MVKIKEYISKNINPYLEEHGGGLEVISYDKDLQILHVRIYGQCSSCPHLIDTNEKFIKVNIYKEFPEIKNIFVENGLNEELWGIAKNILRKEKKDEKLERRI